MRGERSVRLAGLKDSQEGRRQVRRIHTRMHTPSSSICKRVPAQSVEGRTSPALDRCRIVPLWSPQHSPKMELLGVTFDGDGGGLELALCLRRRPAARRRPRRALPPAAVAAMGAAAGKAALDRYLPVPATGDDFNQHPCHPLAAELLGRLLARPGVAERLRCSGEPLTPSAAERWLRARGWNVAAAEEALEEHSLWREAYMRGEGRILEADIQRELAAEKAMLQGVDTQVRRLRCVFACVRAFLHTYVPACVCVCVCTRMYCFIFFRP